jgi:anti-sigma factor RsiW
MSARHWTDDDLINALYGIGLGDRHLEACAECRSRWIAMKQRRTLVTAEPEVPNDFLAAQRRSIYQRMEREGWRVRRLVPAFVAVLALLVALIVYRPATAPAPSDDLLSPDTQQLTSDIYSMEDNPEPQAVKAIHALFEPE